MKTVFPTVAIKRRLGNLFAIQSPPLARFGEAERLAIWLFGREMDPSRAKN
jgi:hypothetical protein